MFTEPQQWHDNPMPCDVAISKQNGTTTIKKGPRDVNVSWAKGMFFKNIIYVLLTKILGACFYLQQWRLPSLPQHHLELPSSLPSSTRWCCQRSQPPLPFTRGGSYINFISTLFPPPLSRREDLFQEPPMAPTPLDTFYYYLFQPWAKTATPKHCLALFI